MGGVERQRSGEWCLLRTNGRGTLVLATSLSDVGIEAWTPKVMMKRRIGHARVAKERETPLMPSFVFAKVVYLDRLSDLSRRPGIHPSFSLFRYLDSLPLFCDRDLEPLRAAEIRAISRSRRRVYRPGQLVRVPEGSFGGMSGIVERSDGRYTLVTFGGRIRVKIETFLLRADMAEDTPSAGADTKIAA